MRKAKPKNDKQTQALAEAAEMKKRRDDVLMGRRLDLYSEGLSDAEIAQRVGTTAGAIQSWRKKRKLPVNR